MVRDLFPGGEGMNFFFNGFESSIEENMVTQQEEEVLLWNVGKRRLRENLVGFSKYDGPMETVEHMWVNI